MFCYLNGFILLKLVYICRGTTTSNAEFIAPSNGYIITQLCGYYGEIVYSIGNVSWINIDNGTVYRNDTFYDTHGNWNRNGVNGVDGVDGANGGNGSNGGNGTPGGNGNNNSASDDDFEVNDRDLSCFKAECISHGYIHYEAYTLFGIVIHRLGFESNINSIHWGWSKQSNSISHMNWSCGSECLSSIKIIRSNSLNIVQMECTSGLTISPTIHSQNPSKTPTKVPSYNESVSPTMEPTFNPTSHPTNIPTSNPSIKVVNISMNSYNLDDNPRISGKIFVIIFTALGCVLLLMVQCLVCLSIDKMIKKQSKRNKNTQTVTNLKGNNNKVSHVTIKSVGKMSIIAAPEGITTTGHQRSASTSITEIETRNHDIKTLY